MEFFCYHRDRPGSSALRDALLKEHWSYMDRYTLEIIARGPTFEGDTPTGSVHIVDLPDPAAARAFAFDEGAEPIETRVQTAPGDYVFVPPYIPHREENPDPDVEAVVVIARTTQEAIVINLNTFDWTEVHDEDASR